MSSINKLVPYDCSPIDAFYRLKKKKPTITVSYYLKNYLLLLNAVSACLNEDKDSFLDRDDLEETFSLGYLEDFYTQKIFYLEGRKSSKSIAAIEIEKDRDNQERYNLFDIVVDKEKAVLIDVREFFLWLKSTVFELSKIEE